jgi:hypothetical protein
MPRPARLFEVQSVAGPDPLGQARRQLATAILTVSHTVLPKYESLLPAHSRAVFDLLSQDLDTATAALRSSDPVFVRRATDQLRGWLA